MIKMKPFGRTHIKNFVSLKMKLPLSQRCCALPVKTTAATKAKDEGETTRTTTTTKRVMSSSSGCASLVTSRVARDARDALHPVATGVCHVCLVNDALNASGVTINENCDPAVRRDVMRAFSELEFDATVMKRSVSVPILSGAMAFGTWQGLYLCNFKHDNNDNKDDDVLIERR